MDTTEDAIDARKELLTGDNLGTEATFQNRMSNLFDKLARGLGWAPNPTKVTHVQWADYANKQFELIEGMFIIIPLPDENSEDSSQLRYELVIHTDIGNVSYAYSLIRTCTIEEAKKHHKDYEERLPPLITACGKEVLNHSTLQKITDLLREKPSWHAGHLVAQFGFLDALKVDAVAEKLNMPEEKQGLYPLHVAVINESEKVITALITNGSRLDIADHMGLTPLHLASTKSIAIIQALKPKGHPCLNMCNKAGETPLLLAALGNKLENIRVLLMFGANINHQEEVLNEEDNQEYWNKLKIVETTKDISHKDLSKGGSLLHWVKTREMTEICLDIGCDTNLTNTSNQSPLHVMVLRNRVQCLVTMLSRGANANLIDHEGNTPLHLAASQCSLTMVQALIVFGSDINAVNKSGETARHMAATHRLDDKTKIAERDKVIYLLHTVGAQRCRVKMFSCTDGCMDEGSFNGVPLYENPLLRSRWVMDEMLSKQQIADGIRWQVQNNPGARGKGRVLCLDGGGIKGLVLTQMLFAIKESLGKPISECFDWISGTSTGGFLALMLATGKSVESVQALYYNLKERVFVGGRPYDAGKLEEILLKEFGEETTMSGIKSPRVMVTSTLADRLPPDLHLFRNYESPAHVLGIEENPCFMKTFLPAEQKLWHAARSSGAAPTYFSASEKFLDGGLIANNPVLDTLTEIEEWNMAARAVGRESEVFTPTVVVSLGCGKAPVQQVDNVDLTMPSLLDLRKSFQSIYNMFNLMVEQACASEGRLVDRARAWCSNIHVPYFRFNPQMSEEIGLDEQDDSLLIRMMWETRAYMTSQVKTLNMLKPLLLPTVTASSPPPTPCHRKTSSSSNASSHSNTPCTPRRGIKKSQKEKNKIKSDKSEVDSMSSAPSPLPSSPVNTPSEQLVSRTDASGSESSSSLVDADVGKSDQQGKSGESPESPESDYFPTDEEPQSQTDGVTDASPTDGDTSDGVPKEENDSAKLSSIE
ncbi:85/88 kDa calcium-independent phospholipase A2-like isoform X2 [Oratosquilla oratoria]|uniref:85/88 kDa calcium-independent phospholipase A2-like isoform X2 n=1 Tax=Oratosquilla oratoria TaxID=337810 RepID=UPI003F775D2E